MTSERGQASVEWVALLLLMALVLAGVLSRAREVDAGEARSLGDELAARIGGGDTLHAARPAPLRRESAVAPGQEAVAPGELFRAGGRKLVAANGLICYLRKSTAPDDTNRVGDDIGDAINCLNPVGGWTGDVGGTDDSGG
jgi:hypothetical protein